ncbi:MAG: hypothetical protein N2490_05590 [Ignavibacteria bacterium]|nr:hypothetical protein [Ignavibacteria bacterium]
MQDKQENNNTLNNSESSNKVDNDATNQLFTEKSDDRNINSEQEKSEKKSEQQSNLQGELEKEQPEGETKTLSKSEISQKELLSKESNYQVSLINENLLRIVVVTDKTVGVDCIVKDKKSDSEESPETQSNKILVNPKEDGSKHEVEIIVAINPSEKQIQIVQSEIKSEDSSSKIPKKKLLIDPSVADLVEEQKKRDLFSEYQYKPKTREEYYQERLKPNNPYRKNLKLIEKNLKVGAVISVIVFLLTIIIYSPIAASKQEGENETHQRLIVIQDVPETVNEVPVKEEEKVSQENDKTDIPSNIVSKPRPTKIKTPDIVKKEIKRDTTKKDTSDIAAINKTLDAERKTSDTLRTDTNYVRNIIDTTGAKVVYMDYQKYGWQKTDEVSGLKLSNDTAQFLTDRSNNRGYGDFDLKIVKDLNGTLFNCKGEVKQFPMKDTSYLAVSCGPLKEEKSGKKYKYYFQVKNKSNTYAVTVIATINDIYLEEYKTKVEDVVSSMRIPKE